MLSDLDRVLVSRHDHWDNRLLHCTTGSHRTTFEAQEHSGI